MGKEDERISYYQMTVRQSSHSVRAKSLISQAASTHGCSSCCRLQQSLRWASCIETTHTTSNTQRTLSISKIIHVAAWSLITV